MKIEEMRSFFAARVEEYDHHMLEEVEGCREGYQRMAALLPDSIRTLLDLGCGTGLELEEIFRRFPELRVTGVDLTQAMLDKCREKYPGKQLQLVNASYFDYAFGTEAFDAAVSFQTMHHFSQEKKLGLYRRLCRSLTAGGCYLECDYMVISQEEEDFYFAENARLRQQAGVTEDEFYHYDTPCTVDNQCRLLREAGFAQVQMVWRQENTTLLLAQKG